MEVILQRQHAEVVAKLQQEHAALLAESRSQATAETSSTAEAPATESAAHLEAQVKEAELKAAAAEAKLKESEAAMTARMEAEALSHKTEVERLQKEKSEAALSLRTTLDSGRSEAIEQATSQVERALERLLSRREGKDHEEPGPVSGDGQDDELAGLEECRLAVEQVVMPQGRPVALLPRSARVRRKQADLAERYRLRWEVFGQAEQCRLRVFPP